MNERQNIQHLFKFDLWCNQILADLFRENAPFTELKSCLVYLSHIINAQEVWFSRVIDISFEEIELWQEHPLGDVKTKANKAQQKWIDLIGDHEVSLDSVIHYNNAKGLPFHNPLWQIAHHLVIHGQHHRAQISLFLKKCDIRPPSIDYNNYSGMAQP